MKKILLIALFALGMSGFSQEEGTVKKKKQQGKQQGVMAVIEDVKMITSTLVLIVNVKGVKQEHKVKITKNIKITRHGKPVSLEEIEPGEKARILFSDQAKKIISEIIIESAAAQESKVKGKKNEGGENKMSPQEIKEQEARDKEYSKLQEELEKEELQREKEAIKEEQAAAKEEQKAAEEENKE
ncbi:MAG: hypothetical protein A2096_13980 [Spirochaetes bacterium GWF1_41_5]|nr:MAG: hypothetical protein A2096_13980 [Spirochaetes bacterium GWF1_41_5]HBE03927.1 hypothetical protein [Spirochaetia bacterium]